MRSASSWLHRLARSRVARVAVSRLAGVACVATLMAACAGPSTTETFYALSDGGVVVSSLPAPAAGAAEPPGIVVSAVSVPELIDRPQIVTRDNANRVVVAEQHLWAESVRAGVARTLAVRLSRALNEAGRPARVAAYPQTSIQKPTIRVTVDVIQFDAVPNGQAIVDALWSVRRVGDQTVRTGRTVAASPIGGANYEAIVEAWNAAVATVDRDIAAVVIEVLPR